MKRIHDSLRVLGSEARFSIVDLLARSHSLCVNSLARRLGMSQSSVSQHLRVLRMAGWVEPERRGYWTHYRLKTQELEKLGRAFLDLASKGPRKGCSGKVRRSCVTGKKRG